MILWTRRPFENREREVLTVEVAKDEAFRHVVAMAPAPVSRAADWTSRVLVAGLKPASTYWYRFTDADGNGSRVGRTITAPDPADGRAVNFTFVSCQSVNDGTLNAYRRMIFEDERAAPADQLHFVLHLGDFIYEVVWYPEDLATRYDRKIYEVARIPGGEKIGTYHFPLTVDGYRRALRRLWPGRRAEQSQRDRQPQGLPGAALRPAPRPDPHRPAQLPEPRFAGRAGARQAGRRRVPGHVPRGADADPRRRTGV